MGFWHTGYMEFHEPEGLNVGAIELSSPRFHCEQCDASFPTFDQLRLHRFERHPSIRPVLFVRGREIGGAPLKITRAIQPSDIQVLHASSAFLNGQSVSPEKLRFELSKMKSTTADIKLLGKVNADFRVEFAIASEQDTCGIEECFEVAARRGRLDRRAVEEFIDTARSYPSAGA